MHIKSITKRLLALAGAAAITLTTIPVTRAADAPIESLAESRYTTDSAAMENLIPAMIRSIPSEAPLTRQQMCTMVMDSYTNVTGLEPEYTEPMFLDTTDADVLNAYHLGLVWNVNAGIFAPENTVSRQDFWTVAVKLLEVLGYPYTNDITMELDVYTDSADVIAYARQPLQTLLCIGAVTTEDGSALEPAAAISTGEAEEILRRLSFFFRTWEKDPVEPQRYLGEEIAQFALNYVGCRYVSGGKGPNKFDCSGFVYYVYKNFGYTLKPGARNQWKTLDDRISKSDLLPGDLVFFSNNGKASGIFHVGIYIGDGQFVHAANSRKGLIVTSMNHSWYANRYLGAKRAIE